jgi:L-2-hydroxyglutarate oxidase LhgO
VVPNPQACGNITSRQKHAGMTEKVDTVVIGAGVVGLACARALAQAGREVIVLETALAIGTGTSSRNSEVIHAGIYYPSGSLKAQLCVRGRDLLYAFCKRSGVEHRRCGKFIVATDPAQLAQLEQLRVQAAANGVMLQPLTQAQACEAEPSLRCVAALHSPVTGIIDSHGLMLALQGELQAAGGAVALGSPVLGARVSREGILLQVGGKEPVELLAGEVINSAGLAALDLARSFQGLPVACVPQGWFAKGNYYALSGACPFSRLIYPIPQAAGLGVHLTIDLAGQARFGPDVQWIDRIDYDVDAARAQAFYAEIRQYWPDLPDGTLAPAYAGIRPKLQAPGEPARDFMIDGPASHGVAGLVNLFGIESPGLTASLAIAQVVTELLSI